MSIDSRREEKLRELRPYIERARTFSGWSFPEIKITHLEAEPAWDYEALVRERLANAASVLDIGTGGAEFYSRVAAGFGGMIVATEEWHVNAPVARDRLQPIGGSVVRAAAEHALPFRDAAFDLIIDRHEGIDPGEVARVLAPSGWFITQQVARENWRELEPHFPRRTQWPDYFRIYQDVLRAAGLEVHGEHHAWRVAYASLGDIVFMLLVAPWEIAGFDPEAEIDQLMALEEAQRTERGIEMTWAREVITAHNGA